jgi:hypothetical protein
MKQLFMLLLITLMTGSVFAAVVIQSPTASREEYSNFLKSQPETVSYSRYFTEKNQSNSTQEELLYKIAENLDSPAKDTLAQLRSVESSGPLSTTSINFIYDLTTKLQDRSDLKNNPELKTLQCKVRGLLAMPLEKCAKVKVDLQAIARQWPSTESILIESAQYDLTAPASLEISSEAIYQFALVSNTHKAIVFKGTYVQLMQQHFVPDPMISGSCDGFSSSIDDFNITSSGLVFFNSNCMKAINTPPSENNFGQWMEKNKSWVYPVGILLLGGAGAYALKDKKIVITKP